MSTMPDGDLKTRLEHGLWLDEIDKAFRLWRAAPQAEKNQHLLTGMMLTWAEGWRLTNPGDFTPSTHAYITRSINSEATRSSGEREAATAETRRRDKVYQQILLVMALFAIVILAPSTLRMYLDHLDRVVLADPGAAATTRPEGPVAPARAAVAASPRAQMQTDRGATSSWTPLRLIERAEAEARAGQPRAAALFALESYETQKSAAASSPVFAQGNTQRVMSLLAATTRATIKLPAAGIEVADSPASDGCAPATRRAVTSTGASVLIDLATAAVTPTASRRTQTGQFDANCTSEVSFNDDYEIFIQAAGSTSIPRRLGAHDASIVGLRFSADGTRVLSVSRDGVGKVWDVASKRPLATLRAEADLLAGGTFSPDGAQVVTWSDGKTIEVFDAARGAKRGNLVGHEGAIVSARFNSTGSGLLTVSVDGTAIVWDVATRALVATLRPKGSSIVDAWISSDARRVVTRLEEDKFQFWSVERASAVAEVDLGDGRARLTTLAGEGHRFAAADGSGRIGVWDTDTGRRLVTLTADDTAVIALAFERAGDTLVAVTPRGVTRWTVPASIDAAIAAANLSGGCWTDAERRALKLEPSAHARCSASSAATDAR